MYNSIANEIESNLKFFLFSNLYNNSDSNSKSNTNIYKFLLNIVALCGIPIIFNLVQNNNISFYNFKRFLFRFRKCSTIIIEGKKCMRYNIYGSKHDVLFSNRFIAFWQYINYNNLNNCDIYCIKECSENYNYDYFDECTTKKLTNCFDTNMFIVNQSNCFVVSKDIYCRVNCEDENIEQRNDTNNNFRTQTINIEIFSYRLSLDSLTKFLDNITKEYRDRIDLSRNNKRFIYTYNGNSSNNNNSYEMRSNDNMLTRWDEFNFISNRTFSNLFFEYKKDLINKLDFFINNRDWYDREGHPYTFGVGLHGPPGTGKTSVIKCIANKLNRHIIVIPLSKIKTQREFNECYFEKMYTRQNNKSIDFHDKIIVFEDIDCMSDIVKQRKSSSNSNNISDSDSDSDNTNIETTNSLLTSLNKKLNSLEKNSNNDINNLVVNIDKDNDKITLSYILNIIDGIRETPGRILIITSNNYESLDKALTRPGRIDITLELKNATRDIIKQMYNHYYGEILSDDVYNKITDYKLSPAEIVNIRLQHKKACNFIDELLIRYEK